MIHEVYIMLTPRVASLCVCVFFFHSFLAKQFVLFRLLPTGKSKFSPGL